MLAGTTVASQEKVAAAARASVLPRTDVERGPDLCLFAGELAASVPPPPSGLKSADGMLWFVRD